MDDKLFPDPFNTDHMPDTPIDWYLQRMAGSGVTENIARLCGLHLHINDYGAYFRIPYYTVEGVETTHFRHRYREPRHEVGPRQSSGNFKGKYWQPPKTKNHLYWPPVESQKDFFYNAEIPLIICEGELKAICCKMHCRKDSVDALVVGVPGTTVPDNVFQELEMIPIRGPQDSRRIVYIAMDWNAKGQSRERAAKMEFDLKKCLQMQGAEVVMLRWETDTDHEQKLDDWLVSGGDLSAALNASADRKNKRENELEAIHDYLNGHYCIMHGSFIPLSNMSQKYTITHLTTMEPGCRLQVSEKRFINPSDVWALQPKDKRNEVDGYVFVPAPLGQEPDRYVWEDGKRLLNTAPPAHWTAPPWAEDDVDVAPFIGLVTRLCQEHGPWFLDFLAHTAQYPTERGAHIVVFKDEGGTGKSRLFVTLDLVFGRYSGPIGDALTSSFNAMLEHLVIAWWSDPVIHGGFDRDLESALKNFSGDSKLMINHKGGAKYVVQGYGRLIIATNKDWIVPVSTKERRFVVFGGLEPMSHHDAGEYMSWLTNGGVEAIQRFLVNRDISNFDIHAQGPVTAQRTAMEKASAHPLIKMLEGELFESKDVWSTDEIQFKYKDNTGKYISAEAVGIEMGKAGMPVRVVKVEGRATRLRVVRNIPLWEQREGKEWASEFKKSKY